MNQTNQRAFFRLSQVTTRLEAILRPSAEKSFWLKAEISSASFTRGHFYCDLVETDSTGKQLAKMRCTIWKGQLETIQRKFKAAGLELELENGKQIGVFCSLTFHALHGLALNVSDADPAFAIGELELRRRELLLKLEREHLFEPNKLIPVSLLPHRIGVITSKGSAGYRDFVHTIEMSGYGFELFVADASMQGQFVEKQVCIALDKLRRLSLDLIVIIRGGGSKTDLSHLDNERIARRIAGSSIPVWTGIGHETDESVLDYVANQKFKTPTAVAVAIVDRFSTVEKRIESATKRIKAIWAFRCSSQHKSFVRWRTGLRQGTRKLLEFSRTNLKRQLSELKSMVGVRVTGSRRHVQEARANIRFKANYLIVQQRSQNQLTRQRIETLTKKRLELSFRNFTWMKQRFRMERFLELISTERNELTKSRVQMTKRIYQVLESHSRNLQQCQRSFRLPRYLLVLSRAQESLRVKQQLVRAADPANNLQKGYSLVYSEEGKLLTSVSTIVPNEELLVKMKDGEVSTKVQKVKRHE